MFSFQGRSIINVLCWMSRLRDFPNLHFVPDYVQGQEGNGANRVSTNMRNLKRSQICVRKMVAYADKIRIYSHKNKPIGHLHFWQKYISKSLSKSLHTYAFMFNHNLLHFYTILGKWCLLLCRGMLVGFSGFNSFQHTQFHGKQSIRKNYSIIFNTNSYD